MLIFPGRSIKMRVLHKYEHLPSVGNYRPELRFAASHRKNATLSLSEKRFTKVAAVQQRLRRVVFERDMSRRRPVPQMRWHFPAWSGLGRKNVPVNCSFQTKAIVHCPEKHPITKKLPLPKDLQESFKQSYVHQCGPRIESSLSHSSEQYRPKTGQRCEYD